MESFGAFLSREREFRGISIKQVYEATKINPSLICAIERESWERLPPKTYMRGHLKAYARYMGLDDTDLVLRYEQALSERSSRKKEKAGPSIERRHGLFTRLGEAFRLSKAAGF